MKPLDMKQVNECIAEMLPTLLDVKSYNPGGRSSVLIKRDKEAYMITVTSIPVSYFERRFNETS